MRFVDTIKNIWKIEDLRKRITITIALVLVYRFGCYVVLPGISPAELDALRNFTSGGLMQLLDMFSGGAFSQASIFALGIMPYITASIVIQLLGMVLPSFQKMQREGESGRTKLNQYTRYLTVFILLLQGPAYLMNLQYQVHAAGGVSSFGYWSILYLTVILAAGSMFIMWLGEKITDKGIGNGISFIILVGIIARFPGAFIEEFTNRLTTAQGGLVMFLVEIILLFAVIAGAVLLVQGTRKVPVQYAKRIVGNKQVGGVRQYIPLKVNAANVMPIIFAQALMFIPLVIVQYSASENSSWFLRSMLDRNSLLYNIVFAALIIAFTYFYTAITLNPTQMAEDMKRNNGFIPGVKPGKDTADYIDDVMSRLTLPGSLFIAFIAIMPALAGLLNVQDAFSQFFGGTSLLILIGVVLDTLQQIESHLMMRHYDGLLNSGKVHSRTGVSAY